MHKGFVGGIVALALVGVGVGGCYVLDNKVRTAVHDSFDELLKASPLVTSASFEGLDVDFFADKLKLHKVQLDLDLSKAPELYKTMPDNVDLKGTLTETIETMTIEGLRDLVLGNSIISRTKVDNIKFSAELTETISVPQTPQQQSLTDQEPPKKPTTITIVMNGALPHAEFFGFNINQLDTAKTNGPIPYETARYEAQDIQLIMSIKQTPQGDMDSLTSEAKMLPPVHADLSIARLTGTDLTKDYIGAIRYENMIVNISDPARSKEPVMIKVAEMSMTDTKIVDMRPLRSTMEIKGLEFDTSKMDNPKGKAMMAMLGIDQINLNMKTSYDFDPDAHTLTVSALRFGLKQAGSIDLNFALAGLPEIEEFEKAAALQKAFKQAAASAPAAASDQAPVQTPEQVQAQTELKAIFKDLSIGQIALLYQDEGILKKFLGAQAMQLNAEPAQVAEAYAQQAAQIITATHGADIAENAQKALTAFLTSPDVLRVELQSTPPVNLQDLSEQFKVSGPMALNAFELNVQGGAEALSH